LLSALPLRISGGADSLIKRHTTTTQASNAWWRPPAQTA
jgi:hypothetical protein